MKKIAKLHEPQKYMFKTSLDLESLLFNKYYTNNDGNEIHETDYEPGNGYEELNSLSPTLQDILNLVPKDIPINKIHVQLSIENSESGNIFEGISMYYYNEEAYAKAMEEYKVALKNLEAK